MSVRVMTAAWAVDLPAGEKLVLLALADCANDEGYCYPGLKSLGRKTGKSRRSLIDTIHALEARGHISRDVVAGKGVNYTIHPTNEQQPELPIGGAKSTRVQELHRCKKQHESGAKSAPKPSGTVISSEAKASKLRAKFPAPLGVSDEQWKAFRSQRKKALNPHSYVLLCNKLTGLAEHGYPPGEMIDLAIERGWETVFEPRNNSNGQQRTNSMGRNQPSDGLSATTRAARDVFGLGASH